MASAAVPATDVEAACSLWPQNSQMANPLGPRLTLVNRSQGPRWEGRRHSPSRLDATGPPVDSLGAVRLLNDLPGRLFEKPDFLFPRPQVLFPESSLRDWVMNKEVVLKEFEWEAVIALSFIILVVAELLSRSNSKGKGPERIQSDDTNERARRALVRQEEEMFEKTRGLAWLAAVTFTFLWIGGVLNHDNALQP